MSKTKNDAIMTGKYNNKAALKIGEVGITKKTCD